MAVKNELFPDIASHALKPLVKWAGGKTQLLPVLRKSLPPRFNRYCEAFVGGGALFWNLNLPNSIICDSNFELVHFYQTIRDCPEELLESVRKLPVNESFYYDIRSKDPRSLNSIERAARFVYLNKTCFNGLYRVNRKGQFNTPFGKKENVIILDEVRVLNASKILKTTEIMCNDYTEALTTLKENDFVYLDPPYLPVGVYSDFNRYTKKFFTIDDHVGLAQEFRKLNDRGVKVLLSNSFHEEIPKLYEAFRVVTVRASRQINCKASGRGKIKELIIANYPIGLENEVS